MKGKIRISYAWCIAWILIVVLVMGTALCLFPLPLVKAEIGKQTITINSMKGAGSPTGYVGKTYASGETWANLISATTGSSSSNSWIEQESYSYSSTDKWKTQMRGCIAWNLVDSGLESLEGVSSVIVKIKFSHINYTFTNGNEPTFSLFLFSGTPENGWKGAIHNNDYNNLRPITRISSEIQGRTEYPEQTIITFPIWEDFWDDIFDFDNQCVYMAWGECTYDWTGIPPTWQNSKIWEGYWYCDATHTPQLIIEGLKETPDRTTCCGENAAVDEETTGFEKTDNITWGSLRCAYADESMCFTVAGDSGAALKLELRDSNGVLLASHTDSIRVDGYYHYSVDLPDSTEGIIRLNETNSAVSSKWGYISPSVSGNQPPNSIMSYDTGYPQYSYDFNKYCVKAGNIMKIHWLCTLEAGELSDASLRLWYLGDNTTVVYNQTLQYMLDNYYLNGNEDNDVMAAWRYAIFTMDDTGSGWNSYDGLVLNINRAYGWDTQGFYQPVVMDDTIGEELTETHSAYWYLSNCPVDGLLCRLDKSDYNSGADMEISFHAGDASKVKTDLNFLRVYILKSNGESLKALDRVVSSEETVINTTAPIAQGNYTARFTLQKADKTYVYAKDVNFTVAGGVEGEEEEEGAAKIGVDVLKDKLDSLLKQYNLDNPMGHWIVAVLAMFLLFVAFYKSKILRVVAPLCILAIMIVGNWLDIWIVALLGFGAGLTIWGIFRRGMSGSKGGEE